MSKHVLEKDREEIYEYILLNLKNNYPDIKFMINDNRETEDFFRILYDDKKLEEDKCFFDYVYHLCKYILEEDDLNRVSVVYDIFNEIEEFNKNNSENFN